MAESQDLAFSVGEAAIRRLPPSLSAYLFLFADCLANIAFCFFWLAAAVCAFFCAACLFTDFGDLSPIVGLLSATDYSPAARFLASGIRSVDCMNIVVKQGMSPIRAN